MSESGEEVEENEHVKLFKFHRAQKMKECLTQIEEERKFPHLLDGFCETIWDDAICWSKTIAGSTQTQPCPDYIIGFNSNQSASKHCTSDATWFLHPEINSTWTNYTQCRNFPNATDFNLHSSLLHQDWVPIIKKISQIGYGISLLTLLLAFFILISIKKLRCPRNTLHIHLFLSFMLRAFVTLLKDFLFVEGIGLSASFEIQDENNFVFNHSQSNWECKLVTSLWEYFLLANYTWILMEGLYLHNLIFLAPFSDSSAITLYVLLGWGVPLGITGSWVAVRAFYEDNYCWTTHDNKNLFLIIRIPVIISIVLNFLFFLNIVRVLLLKLQSAVSIETRKYRYRKWAKSTLVLMPLFGVHYMIFLWMSSYVGKDPTIEIIWLFCDQFFASFQGFIVSILYCLLNGEVRSELGKKWSKWRSESDSKNIWVPLNQISSKFYHRSTHEDILIQNPTDGGSLNGHNSEFGAKNEKNIRENSGNNSSSGGSCCMNKKTREEEYGIETSTMTTNVDTA